MSGSPSRGSQPGWPEDDRTPCSELEFETHLSSPQADAIEGVHPGELLPVAIDTRDGVRKVAVYREGDIAGTITADRLPALLRCLQQGQAFVAEVIRVDGGAIRIRVHTL